MSPLLSIGRSLALKRCFDVLAASLGIVVLSPVLLLIGLAVAVDSPGPVLFRQSRIGKNESEFEILKFRTMRHQDRSAGPQVTSKDDPRITRVGRVLRDWKLDELPQLFNVICGDMSLVGPRPEVPKFADSISSEQRSLIFSVRPGITDFAALEYRNEEAVLAGSEQPERVYVDEILPAKLALYERYIRERTIWLDVRLIVKTVSRLIGLTRA